MVHCNTSIHVCSQYLLRDILQFDNTLTDSMTRMTNAHRTCNLILGVGDGKVGKLLKYITCNDGTV